MSAGLPASEAIASRPRCRRGLSANVLVAMALAAGLGACASHPDPAFRPTRTDIFTQTTDFLTPAPASIRHDGVRLSNHVSDVRSSAYGDWCPIYRIGCPQPPIYTRHVSRRVDVTKVTRVTRVTRVTKVIRSVTTRRETLRKVY